MWKEKDLMSQTALLGFFRYLHHILVCARLCFDSFLGTKPEHNLWGTTLKVWGLFFLAVVRFTDFRNRRDFFVVKKMRIWTFIGLSFGDGRLTNIHLALFFLWDIVCVVGYSGLPHKDTILHSDDHFFYFRSLKPMALVFPSKKKSVVFYILSFYLYVSCLAWVSLYSLLSGALLFYSRCHSKTRSIFFFLFRQETLSTCEFWK